jgi:hypothetical protein
MEELRKRIVEEIEREVMKTISALAEKYVMNKRKEIAIPYVGEKEKWCGGMKICGGLYNQCRKEREGKKRYCKECSEEASKNEGVPYEGDIKERKKWKKNKDREGKKLLSYMTYLEERNLTREDAETEAMRHGIVIPEEYFEKKTRGRPKKEEPVRVQIKVEVKEDEKSTRGRPAKEEKVVTSYTGDDLISRLLEEARKKGLAKA